MNNLFLPKLTAIILTGFFFAANATPTEEDILPSGPAVQKPIPLNERLEPIRDKPSPEKQHGPIPYKEHYMSVLPGELWLEILRHLLTHNNPTWNIQTVREQLALSYRDNTNLGMLRASSKAIRSTIESTLDSLFGLNPALAKAPRLSFEIRDRKDLSRLTGEMVQNLNNLGITVKLWECASDKTLEQLAEVERIDLSFCHNITDAGLKYLKKATHVSLVGCLKITDEGLEHLANATHVYLGLEPLANETRVYLPCCPRITDAGLTHLKEATHLSLTTCPQITGTGFNCLTKATHVSLIDCDNITEEAVQALRDRGVLVDVPVQRNSNEV